MSTLRDIQKASGLTQKQIGQKLGCSASLVSHILHGGHISVCTDEEIEQLAQVLGITFERCWYAMCESYKTYYHDSRREIVRPSITQMRVEREMDERFPEWNIPITTPRPMTTVDAISYLGEGKESYH